MATFDSFSALEQRIIKDVQTAARNARDRIDRELFLNVNDYYNSPTPKIYQRTGTLLTSPETTPVQGSGKHLSFESYMNEGISYATGTFSGAQVIDATENGGVGTLGNQGYFRKTEEAVPQILDNEFNKL